MSGDEVLATVVSGAVGVFLWGRHAWFILRPPAMVARGRGRTALLAAPLACLLALLAVLLTFSSSDVRTDAKYVAMYTLMGAGWIGIAGAVFPVLGLQSRRDVLERGNRAAAFAYSGALLGFTLAFAGGNIGDGPGWWVVVACAGLSSAALALLWIGANAFFGMTEAVTVDRSTAAGVRMGALLVSAGAVLGRSVAGTWTTWDAAVQDFFALAWPVAVLLVAEAAFSLLGRPTAQRPSPDPLLAGLIPAVCHLAIGTGAIVLMGWWT